MHQIKAFYRRTFYAYLLQVNSGVRGEHVVFQFLWATPRLLHIRVNPIQPVNGLFIVR